ncbi:MAG TPA: hypothetical protein VKK79_08925 [Candidatus Lokiarchaeia archaeon]|nr:hypothetical protein [Candidatus Lokiarchaeia archaeon]
MVFISVDEDRVRELAESLSKEQKSWDDWVWLFAEAELRLRPACEVGVFYSEWGDTRQIEVNPDLLVAQPPERDIRELAGEISKLRPWFQDLHWFIAERRIIYDSAKGAAE